MYYVEFVSQIYYTKKLNPTLVEYFPINTKKYYENFICNFIEKKEEGEREREKEEERVRSGGRILRSRPLFAILQTLFYRLNRSWMFFFFILFFCLPSDRIGARSYARGSKLRVTEDHIGNGWTWSRGKSRFELEPFCSRCWVVLLIEISGSPRIPFFFWV